MTVFQSTPDRMPPSGGALRARLCATTALLAALTLVSVPALAQTWDGETGVSWGTGANWNPDGTPGVGDTATIAGAGGVNQPIVDSNQTVAQTNVTDGTLTVSATLTSPVNVSGTGNLVVNAGGQIIGAVTYDGETGTNNGTITGNLNVNGDTFTNAGTITGTVTVADGATLAISGDSTNELITLNGEGDGGRGALRSVNEGTTTATITLASDSQITLSSGLWRRIYGTISGTDVDLTLSTTAINNWGLRISSDISLGSGSLIIDGQVWLSGNNSFTGDVWINDGLLLVQSEQAIPDTALVTISSDGHLRIDANKTVGNFVGDGFVAIMAGRTFTAGDATDSLFSGQIINLAGSGFFRKTGTGTMTLTGYNTYQGATTIKEGVLSLTGMGRLASRFINIYTDSKLSTDGGAFISWAEISNAGGLELTGSETVGSVSGSGAIMLIGADTTLTLSGSDSTTISGVISGTGNLTRSGTGTTTLTAQNTYTGTTTISGGTIRMGGNDIFANASSLVISGGILDMNT